MALNEFQLSDYNRIIYRQFKFICIVATVVTVSGYIIGINLPMKFRAKAILKIDFSQFFDGAYVDPILFAELEENVTSMMVDIKGQTVLFRAAQVTGDISDTVLQANCTLNDLKIIETYRDNISLHPLSEEKQIEIEVVAPSPKKAAAIANAVGETYQSYSFNQKKEHFFRKEIKIKETLEKCQMELSDIAQKMIRERNRQQGLTDTIYMQRQTRRTEELSHEHQNLTYLLSSVSSLRHEVFELRSQLEKSKQLSSYDKQTDTVKWLPNLDWITELAQQDPGLESLNERITSLCVERSTYLKYYRPKHPRIINIDNHILRTADEIEHALDRNETVYKNKRTAILTKQKALTEKTSSHFSRMHTLDRLQQKYAAQEAWCESISKKLTEVRETERGLMPFVSMLTRADIPDSPQGPGVAKATVAGLTAGLLLGIFLAIFKEIADTSFSTIEDIRRIFGGYAILSVIPRFKINKRQKRSIGHGKTKEYPYNKTMLPALFKPGDPLSDSFRMLSVQLEQHPADIRRQSILVTSTLDREGKSFVAANLALTLAFQEKKVVLVEANFRYPSLASLFGLPALSGLMETLIEEKRLDECIVTITDLLLGSLPIKELIQKNGIDNFSLIPFGSFPSNPGELLASSSMRDLLQRLRDEYDHIIIDTPSAVHVSDPIVLSKYCDGVILVYQSDKASRHRLVTTIQSLENTGTPFLGLVLNQWRLATSDLVSGSQ